MNTHMELGWVAENELPECACLKVVRSNNPDNGLSADEIQERNEFISWYMMQDYTLVMMIPRQDKDDFFIDDFTPEDEEYSAFNTVDYHRTLRPFDRYGYAIRKIMERVKDLALIHSVISSQEDRQATYTRYEGIIDIEFRARLMALVERFQNTSSQIVRSAIKSKIGELNRRILEARKVWEQYAPWDR